MTRLSHSTSRSALLLIALAAATSLFTPVAALAQPLGTAFTYQANLTSNNLPASAPIDVRFRLFTAAIGGTQIGSTIQLSNITPTNGQFSASLDFGAVFSTNRTYLEVQVSPASLNSYTTLTPRQEITPTPVAQHAISATSAATLNGQPSSFFQNASNITTGTVPDARLSTNVPRLDSTNIFTGSTRFTTLQLGTAATAGHVLTTNASGVGTWQPLSLSTVTGGLMTTSANFVGVGRSAPISGAERFGITVPTTATGEYGGMYIVTGDSGRPFYGFNTNFASAWAYLDGSDSNKFKLYNAGDRVTVTTTGNVGLGTTSPVTRLDVVGTTTTTDLAFRDGSVQTTAALDPLETGFKAALNSTARYTVTINDVNQNAYLPTPLVLFKAFDFAGGTVSPNITVKNLLTIRRPFVATSTWRTAFLNNQTQTNVQIVLDSTATGIADSITYNFANCTTAAYRLILTNDGLPVEELDLAFNPSSFSRTRTLQGNATPPFPTSPPSYAPRNPTTTNLATGSRYRLRIGSSNILNNTILISDAAQTAPVDLATGARTGSRRPLTFTVATSPRETTDLFPLFLTPPPGNCSLVLLSPTNVVTILATDRLVITDFTLQPTDDGLLTEVYSCSLYSPI